MGDLQNDRFSPETLPNRETFFARLIRVIMFSILAIYPFGMAVPVIWNRINGDLGIDEVWLVTILSAMPLFVLLLLWRFVPQKISSGSSTAICFIMFCISLAARILCSVLMQTEPFSDFGFCYEYAAKGTAGDWDNYLGKFPYLGAYALTLRGFFCVTGASVFNAQLLNAIVTSFVPVFLFLAVKRVTQKANVAIVAGLCYAVYPSMIIYTAVPSCEHFAQFYMGAFICSIAYFCTEKLESRKRWVYACAAGITFGGLCAYKELFIVVAPALLMVSFCYEITPIIAYAISRKRFDYKKLIRILLLDLLVVLLALGVSKGVIHSVQVEIIGTSSQRNSPFSVTVYEGLSEEGGGVWNQNVKSFVSNTLETSETSEDVDQILYGKLYEEYKDNPGNLLKLIYNKFRINWCDESAYYYWTFCADTNVIQGHRFAEVLFNILPNIWSMIMFAVICVGCILSLLRKDSSAERYFDFLVTGIVFLFALALVIMEAQGRYKSNLSPLFCVIFALSIDRILYITGNLAGRAIKKANMFKR